MFQRTVAGGVSGAVGGVPPRADVAVALGTVLLTARFGEVRRAMPVLDLTRML